MPPKADINKATWEDSDVPAVCETCLGPNPYVRMLKEQHGRECKICTRPFTVFRWIPDKSNRYWRTGICQTCARQKNCCQCCMLDLSFGLPLSIRDAALKLSSGASSSSGAPSNTITKQYIAQNSEGQLKGGEVPEQYSKMDSAARQLLKKLANSSPYQRRRFDESNNTPRQAITSGKEDSSVREGESGGRIDKFIYVGGSIEPPKDQSIMSLFLTGVEEDLPEHAIRSFFADYGPVKSLVCSHRTHCAFVNFATRQAAESAARSTGGTAIIRGCRLKVSWGKPRPIGDKSKMNAAYTAAKQERIQRRLAEQEALAAKDDDNDNEKESSSSSPRPPPGAATGQTKYLAQTANYEE